MPFKVFHGNMQHLLQGNVTELIDHQVLFLKTRLSCATYKILQCDVFKFSIKYIVNR